MLTSNEKDILRMILFSERTSPQKMKEISEMSDEEVRGIIALHKSKMILSINNQINQLQNRLTVLNNEEE